MQDPVKFSKDTLKTKPWILHRKCYWVSCICNSSTNCCSINSSRLVEQSMLSVRAKQDWLHIWWFQVWTLMSGPIQYSHSAFIWHDLINYPSTSILSGQSNVKYRHCLTIVDTPQTPGFTAYTQQTNKPFHVNNDFVSTIGVTQLVKWVYYGGRNILMKAGRCLTTHLTDIFTSLFNGQEYSFNVLKDFLGY